MSDTPNDTSKKTLAERLADAQARRVAAQKAAEETAQLQEVEAEEKAAELEEQHGSIKVAKVTTEAGPFVLLRPPGLAWDAWERALTRSGKNPVAQKDIDKFLHPAIKYPANFEKVLEDSPGIQGELIVVLSRLYGAKTLDDLGK